METHEKLNILAQPADMAIGMVMKSAQAVGAYEPVRGWMLKLVKNNMLAGFKKKFDLEVIGAENVPKEGGGIIVANHQSWLDAQVLGSSADRYLHFIAKSEFTEWPLLSKFIEFTESVYIKRKGGEDSGLSEIVQKLKDGWLLAVFPEGTIPGEEDITRDELDPKTGLLKGKSGVVRLAIEAGVPIIPAGISGPGQAYPPEMYPRLEMPPIQKPVPVTIRYGKPITFKETSLEDTDKATIRKHTDAIMMKLSKLIDHRRGFMPVDVPIKFNEKGIKYTPKRAKGTGKASHGVLVFHGFTSHLDCVAPIENALKGLKIPYRFPVLRGHGTWPHNMVGTGSKEWYEDGEKALLELSKHCEKVIVVGLSMGGLVTINLGINHPDIISDTILIAPCLKFADPLSGFTPVLCKVFKYWESPNSFVDMDLKEKLNKNYPVFATESFASLFDWSKETVAKLKDFDRPTIILQSKKDTIVAPKAANIFFKTISTPAVSKKIVWFKKSGHEMCLDLEAKDVLEVIARQINKIVGND